jgi:hypothetical protein
MTTFTLIHVAISLVAILSGLVVLGGLLAGNSLNIWTSVFLTTTVATSVTGFFYLPFRGFTPAQAFGIPVYYFRDRLGLERSACVAGAVGATFEFSKGINAGIAQ